MRFDGIFTCSCGKQFTLELGPLQMKKRKTPAQRAKLIGDIALLLGRSCEECESGHGDRDSPT